MGSNNPGSIHSLILALLAISRLIIGSNMGSSRIFASRQLRWSACIECTMRITAFAADGVRYRRVPG